jgi:hypothetical protein
MNAKRFRVAFSFAGEKRAFIAQVAAILAKRFGEGAILYDKYHTPEFSRSDLAFYLPKLYEEESDLVVAVFCPDYDKKEWCGLEWNAIYSLLKARKADEVMLARFERTEGVGLHGLAGYTDLDGLTPEQAADGILQRLALNEGKPKDHYIAAASGSGVGPSSGSEIQVIADSTTVMLSTKRGMPQWVDHRELDLGGGRLKAFRCEISTESPYFRFGLKLLKRQGRLFGDASIQSKDTNLLFHIGRNDWNRPDLGISANDVFFTWFVNGVSPDDDKKLFESRPRIKALFDLKIDSGNILDLRINGVSCLQRVIPAEIRRRVALLAWGDRHAYAVEVRNISVNTT